MRESRNMKLNRIAWTVCAAVFCGSVLTASASTGSYEGVVTSVDGCEGGFDNGKHKAGEWRWYCNGWRYLYPGYHEVTLRKREAGYATDRIVVTADHAFQPSGTGPAASPQESDGKKAHVGKDGMVLAEAENYASLNDRGHGENYAKGSSYKGFTGSGYVISPKGDNTSWADGPEVRIRIKIDKAGKYYFWQRVGGSSNSGYLGIDTARVFALNEKGVTRFSAKITAFDYTSYGRWGRDSKQGETGPPVGVNKVGTVCILNGNLVNAHTFASAVQPGTRGFFYEHVFQSLYTTGDFEWGEVVAHDADSKSFSIRIYPATYRPEHGGTNPPYVKKVKYDSDTVFRLREEQNSTPDKVLVADKRFVQIHPPRKQTIEVVTPRSKYDSSEYYEPGAGGRGDANNKSAPAILTKIGHLEYRVAKNDAGQEMMPGKAPGTFTANVERNGRWESENVTTSNKCVWVLDGKICPPNIAFRPGRRAVLGAYRNSPQPHRMFVSSFEDAVRGVIKSFDGTSIVVEGKDYQGKSFSKTIRVADDAAVMVDGLQASVKHALVVGRTVAVHPARGKTIIAFTRGLPKRAGDTSF